MKRTRLLVALIGGLLFGGTLQAQQPNFSGVYVSTTRAQLQLNPDGSLTIRSANGRVSPGRFTVNGDTLTLIDSMGSSYPLTIRGDNLYRDGGLAWIWRGTPTPVPTPAPATPVQDQGEQVAPVGPYAAYAGEYVFEMTGTHYIFHPDGSCTVRNPGGTESQMHFIVEGDWIRMTMKMGNSDFPMGSFKKQGDKLYMNGAIYPNAELVRQGVSPAPTPETEAVAPPAPAQHHYEDVAPPPLPPAPAPTISMGQTKDQVTAAFGEPQRKATAGPKEIFFYTDLKMKVTFTNGKVSSID